MEDSSDIVPDWFLDSLDRFLVRVQTHWNQGPADNEINICIKLFENLGHYMSFTSPAYFFQPIFE